MSSYVTYYTPAASDHGRIGITKIEVVDEAAERQEALVAATEAATAETFARLEANVSPTTENLDLFNPASLLTSTNSDATIASKTLAGAVDFDAALHDSTRAPQQSRPFVNRDQENDYVLDLSGGNDQALFDAISILREAGLLEEGPLGQQNLDALRRSGKNLKAVCEGLRSLRRTNLLTQQNFEETIKGARWEELRQPEDIINSESDSDNEFDFLYSSLTT